MSLLRELRRRNVFRMAIAYLAVSWLLIQIVETLFPVFGLSDQLIRGFVIVVAIGFPVALILSWVYEITPEGLTLEKNVDRSQSITHHTGRKLDRIIIVVLVLAVAYFSVDKFVFSDVREASIAETARSEGRSEAFVESFGDRSIAVLPFVDMSPDGDQEYFSDGLSEELLNLLARIKQLRVISRTSAFSFKGKDLPLSEIGRRLNAVHILEGSVRKSGNRIRITAQLINTPTDTHIWSETWDRDLDDIFAIQDEIAEKVVERLKLSLLEPVPKVRETDPAAYELYLRAKQLKRMSDADAMQQSIAMMKQVVTIDPDYAGAWIVLATSYMDNASYFGAPYDEGYQLAREAIDNAIAADPDYGIAYLALADIALTYDNDTMTAVELLQKGLSKPSHNTYTYAYAAFLVSFLGMQDEAIRMLEFVTRRDPLAHTNFNNLGWMYQAKGEYEQSIEAFQVALGLSPEMIAVNYGIGKNLLLLGEPDRALASFQQEPHEPFRVRGEISALYALGRTQESDAMLEAAISEHEQDWPFLIAAVYAHRGNVDEAFRWMEKAVEYGDQEVVNILNEPLLAGLADDERWLPLLRQLNMAPDQLPSFELNVTIPE